MRGFFISLEGPDGAGKSTVLSEVLKKIGPEMKTQYLVTREPGGSKIAEDIRAIILDPNNKLMDYKTEALLYAACRGQHVEEIIKPALKAGKTVFSDRYVDSSLAYQGVGRQLGIKEVKAINDFATSGLEPDLTLFFKIDPKVGLSRIQKNRESEDRLEQEKLAFHEKVYEGYEEINKIYSDRIAIINADQPIDIVIAETIQVIKNKLPELF